MNTNIDLRGLRVLLVDDDDDCREFLAMVLENEGMVVTQAADAEKAVELLKVQQFHVVTTDKNLPGMDGISLIKYIRKHHGDIPVILITGHGSITSAIDAIRLGAQEYLLKPLERGDELVGAIWRAVEHFKMAQENRALQEKLVRAERMESLGILAGGIAHDLNNILCPVVALPPVIITQLDELIGAQSQEKMAEIRRDLEVLAQTSRHLDDIKEELRLMENAGKKAAMLVQDLMTASVTGNYERQPHQINATIREFARSPEFVEMRLARTDVYVKTELASEVPRILASGPHIQRILSILCQNALEAMHPKGNGQEHTLTIQTSSVHVHDPIMGLDIVPPGPYVMLEVSDSGTGIREENRHRIFEPFFSTKETPNISGTGLSLSIAHRIIKDHEALIDLESSMGKGTRFRIYFPALSADHLAAPHEETAPTGTEHVLVVDDEAAQRYVVKRVLTQLGYAVTTAANGHEAVKVLQAALAKGGPPPYDLVLLDMVMEEGFDGLATHQEIVKLYPAQKIIVASGYAATGRAKESLAMGAGWLPKPFSMKDLASSIRKHLDAVKPPGTTPTTPPPP